MNQEQLKTAVRRLHLTEPEKRDLSGRLQAALQEGYEPQELPQRHPIRYAATALAACAVLAVGFGIFYTVQHAPVAGPEAGAAVGQYEMDDTRPDWVPFGDVTKKELFFYDLLTGEHYDLDEAQKEALATLFRVYGWRDSTPFDEESRMLIEQETADPQEVLRMTIAVPMMDGQPYQCVDFLLDKHMAVWKYWNESAVTEDMEPAVTLYYYLDDAFIGCLRGIVLKLDITEPYRYEFAEILDVSEESLDDGYVMELDGVLYAGKLTEEQKHAISGLMETEEHFYEYGSRLGEIRPSEDYIRLTVDESVELTFYPDVDAITYSSREAFSDERDAVIARGYSESYLNFWVDDVTFMPNLLAILQEDPSES